MATLHELSSQIDRGQTAVLFSNEDGENVKVSIRKNKQGQYTRTFSYLDRPNPFTQQRTEPYSSWDHLLADIRDSEQTGDRWKIE